MLRHSLLCAVLVMLLAHSCSAQFFVRLDQENNSTTGTDVGEQAGGDAAAAGEGGGEGSDLESRWKDFVRWFRENGGIISSKLTLKERAGRQGVFFKERMRRGETIVSFPRTLRMDEKSAMKSKHGDMWRTLKEKEVYPDLRMVLYLGHEYFDNSSFWRPYMNILPKRLNNIMYLTDAEMRKMLRRPGCENTHNFGVGMRRTFSKFYNQYKTIVEPLFPEELAFTRDQLVHAYNLLLTAGWGTGDGTGDKYLVPFSDTPVHRRESAQKANNRGFISAAKMYEAGEELTFDYGLVNPEVLAFYGTPTPDCRGLKR